MPGDAVDRLSAHVEALGFNPEQALIAAYTVCEAADSLAKASSPEPFSASKTSNWVARAGGLPAYIQHVAHDIHERRGKTISEAIRIAIGVIKNWAHGHGNVDSGTKAAAAKALGEWTAMKAKNAAKSVAGGVGGAVGRLSEAQEGWDPTVDLEEAPDCDLNAMADAARSRLVIAEGVSSVGKRKRNGVTDQFVRQLWPEPPADLEAALREEVELDRLLVEAVAGEPEEPSSEAAELAEAEDHHKIKCPKCDAVQKASNKECAKCGHDLGKARKAKFAKLGEGANPYILREETATAEPPVTELTLKPGDGGDERVKHLQTRLAQLGHKLDPDGIYGDGTRSAVAEFQSKAGLLGTGEVDEVTVKALRTAKEPTGSAQVPSEKEPKAEPKAAEAERAEAGTPKPSKPEPKKDGRATQLADAAIGVLRRETGTRAPREQRQATKAVQDALSRKGYDPGPTDGRFGQGTEKAVKAFQREHGLRTDGKVGRHTSRMLDLLQKAQEQDKLEETIEEAVRSLHVPFNPALHPRGRAGKFAETLGHLTGPRSTRQGGWSPSGRGSGDAVRRAAGRAATDTDAKLPSPPKAGPDRLPGGTAQTSPTVHHGARLTDVHVRRWSTPHLQQGANVFKPGTSAHEAVANELARRGRAGPKRVRTIKPPLADKSPPTKGPDKLPRGRVKRQGLPPTRSRPPDPHPHTGTKSPGKTGPRSEVKPGSLKVSPVYHDTRGKGNPWSYTVTDGLKVSTERHKDPEAAKRARAAIAKTLGTKSPGKSTGRASAGYTGERTYGSASGKTGPRDFGGRFNTAKRMALTPSGASSTLRGWNVGDLHRAHGMINPGYQGSDADTYLAHDIRQELKRRNRSVSPGP